MGRREFLKDLPGGLVDEDFADSTAPAARSTGSAQARQERFGSAPRMHPVPPGRPQSAAVSETVWQAIPRHACGFVSISSVH